MGKVENENGNGGGEVENGHGDGYGHGEGMGQQKGRRLMAARKRNIVQALHFLRATTGRRCWITNGMAPGTAGHDYGFGHWDVQVGILLGKAHAAQEAPRGPQEAPKGPQEAPKRPSICSRDTPKMPPRRPRERSENTPEFL